MSTEQRTLTRGQAWVLAAAGVPMVAFGALGAVGTYANVTSVFQRSATALGVVAAGEGATLVLALVLVGLTMLGQSAPTVVRVGLWTLPAVASATGAALGTSVVESVVFAVTPLAMCVSAEGMGLLARRIVTYRTGIDAEAQRRTAQAVQQLAYHRARAANHPDDGPRKRSARAAWRLARRVGVNDAELGAGLVSVQRRRLTAGADAALAGMFGNLHPVDEVTGEHAPLETAVRVDRASDQTTEVTTPQKVVTSPSPELVIPSVHWKDAEDASDPVAAREVFASAAPREVVTEPVAATPTELRRKARTLHRHALKQTRRPVTIKTLQDELRLSRRDARDLRREVVEEAQS